MELTDYILTQQDLDRLAAQGIRSGAMVGENATPEEIAALGVTAPGPEGAMSVAEISRISNNAISEAEQIAGDAISAAENGSQISVVGADGTRTMEPVGQGRVTSRAPSNGGSTGGLSGLLTSFMPTVAGGGFTGPVQAQSIDPYEGLSRNQRMVLGFAALRDAAASLNGRDTSFFNDQLGLYEDARERERLRVQGQQQNRANTLLGLLPVFERIQYYQERGAEVPQYLQDILRYSLPGGFGGDAGGVPGVTPAAATGGVSPADQPIQTMPLDTPSGQPEDPSSRRAAIADELARKRDLLSRATSAEARAALEGDIEQLSNELDEIDAATQRFFDDEEVAIGARWTIGKIDALLNDPNLGNVLGPQRGRLTIRTAEQGASLGEQAASMLLLNDEDADLVGRIDQLRGQTFLTGFDQLRGGGQITVIEGVKAENALSRINNRLTTEADYRQALRELQMISENALAHVEGRPKPHPEMDTLDGVDPELMAIINRHMN